jgi:hypothetical protein
MCGFDNFLEKNMRLSIKRYKLMKTKRNLIQIWLLCAAMLPEVTRVCVIGILNFPVKSFQMSELKPIKK